MNATLRTVLALALSLSLSVPGWAAAPQAGSMHPRIAAFLQAHGPRYGLEAASDGGLLYRRHDKALTLSPSAARQVGLFLSSLPEQGVEAAMAAALRTYLQDKPLGTLEARLFAQGPEGEALTEMGRKVLMDILTAEDGLTFKASSGKPAPQKGDLGSLKKLRMTGRIHVTDPTLDQALGGVFDRSGRFTPAPAGPGMLKVGSFEWSQRAPSGDGAYEGYHYDAQKGTVRMMVAARRAVGSDHLVVGDKEEGAEVLAETGLDPALLKAHGAQVVRAIRNLVMLDVPVAEAGKLGASLQSQGLESRPARVVAARTALPASRMPLSASLPLRDAVGAMPVAPFSAAAAGSYTTMNAGASDLMKIGALHKRGWTGKGTVVGVIDSGLDLTHPDFKDRVAAYIDLTNDGLKDPVAHGTHVAGSIGGSGAASGGKYKGMAPDTRFVILRVFGKTGSTSEDTILAAMAAARNMPAEIRPQVLNMSLGGPGDPETDPLSVLANEMMLKDNILMAIAGGNSGPSKGTIGAPGNARHVLTVTGVNHDGKFSFFPSRGPVETADGGYNKPDLSTVAGDVNLSQQRKAFWRRILHPLSTSSQLGLFPQSLREEQPVGACVYGPGVISARSSDDEDTDCVVAGQPQYRFMSGTSMATPMAAGIAADVIGYLKEKGKDYKATEIKALMMETADDLGQPAEVQGAGLVNGERLAKAVEARVQKNLPVGNVAYMLSKRGYSKWDEFNMRREGRYERTPLGLLDTKTGHLINTDEAYEAAAGEVRQGYQQMPVLKRAVRRIQYWIQG